MPEESRVSTVATVLHFCSLPEAIRASKEEIEDEKAFHFRDPLRDHVSCRPGRRNLGIRRLVIRAKVFLFQKFLHLVDKTGGMEPVANSVMHLNGKRH